MKLNLNDTIKVKLSKIGLKRLEEINNEMIDIIGRKGSLQVDEHGYISMQLWNFMQKFGDMMRLGRISPVECGEILLENKISNGLIAFDIKNLEPFQNIVKILSEISMDERISYKVREEYMLKFISEFKSDTDEENR